MRVPVALPTLVLLILAVACDRREASGAHDDEPERADDHGRDDHSRHDDHEGHAHGQDEGGAHAEGVVELPEESVARIVVTPVERRRIFGERETTGQVDYVQSAVAHVAPRIPGRLHRILAHLGDEVRPGQPVAEIDSVELGTATAAYVQARTREDLARRTHDREKSLHEERISSESEMLEAEAAWQEAHAATEAAAQALRLYGLDEGSIRKLEPGKSSAIIAVRAPIAGRIIEHHGAVGELVTPETRLMTVADLSRVWVWIDVPERDVAAVHPDDDVEVTADAYAREPFAGKVSYLTPEVDAHARTVRARIEIENRERKLLPGMFVKVRISDPHGAPLEGLGVLAVPPSAVQRDGAETMVFVSSGPRRFERRVVTLGRTTTEWVEVTGGVAEGEQVVVEGAFILKSEAARHELGGGHSH